MEKLRKSRMQGLRLLMIGLSLIVFAASGAVTIRAQNSSAVSSQPSATPAPETTPLPAGFVQACGEAIEELRATRKALASQDILSSRQDELLKLERQFSDGLKNLRSLDAAQISQLEKAIAAKDRVITATEAEVAVLKKQRMTVWKKVKWFVIGGAAGIIAGSVLK